MPPRSRLRQILQPRFRVLLVLALLTTVVALSPARAGSVLEDAMARVFVVRSDGAGDRFLGSAFRWGAVKVAVTNAHVTGGADAVRLVDQAGRVRTARVIGRDSVRDVAILARYPPHDRPATRPDSGIGRPRLGAWCAARP